MNMTDQQIIDARPPWTGYNSYEGSRIINGTKYYDGEKLPDGSIVHAPILDDEQWAARYETYPTISFKQDKHGHKIKVVEYKPAKLNSVDKHFMAIMNLHDRVMIIAFRDARKSSNLLRFIKRQILDNQATVSYFASTSTRARLFSMKIREQIMRNVAILKDYGYIVDDEQGNRKDEMFWVWQKTATREPGLTIGSIEGKPLTGGHPDVIGIDDVVEDSVSGHEEHLARHKDWYNKQIEPMATEHTKVLVVGTIKDPHDLYNYIEHETEMFDVIKIPAILEWPNFGQMVPGTKFQGTSQWYYEFQKFEHDLNQKVIGVGNIIGGKAGFDEYQMEKWSTRGRTQYYIDNDINKGIDKNRMALQEFLLKLKAMGSEAFASEFQMQCLMAKEGMLNFSRVQHFTMDELYDRGITRQNLLENCVAMFDQAFGESNRADFNCITVVAKYIDDYFLLDGWIWKNDESGVFRKIKMIETVYEKYPEIRTFGIEAGEINTSDMNIIIRTLEDKVPLKPVYQNALRKKTEEDDSEGDKNARQLIISFMDDVKKEKKAKAIRIVNQFTVRLGMNHVLLRDGIEAEFMEEVEREMAKFPKPVKFDALDSWGSGMDLSDEFNVDDFYFGHG